MVHAEWWWWWWIICNKLFSDDAWKSYNSELSHEDCMAAISRSTGLQQPNADDHSCPVDTAKRSCSADWQFGVVDDWWHRLFVCIRQLSVMLCYALNSCVSHALVCSCVVVTSHQLPINKVSLSDWRHVGNVNLCHAVSLSHILWLLLWIVAYLDKLQYNAVIQWFLVTSNDQRQLPVARV